MVFLAVFMMPFYYGSKARSVPEYLKLRFDERTRCLNSISFAVMTVLRLGHLDGRLAQAARTSFWAGTTTSASGSARRWCWSTCSRAD